MTFLTPIWLLLLLPVAALAAARCGVAASAALRRALRQPADARARCAPPPWLAPARPGTLVLLALTCLGLAAARPEMTLRLPVRPGDRDGRYRHLRVDGRDRRAAEPAGGGEGGGLRRRPAPDTVNVGIVSFAGSSVVVSAPTADHARSWAGRLLDLGGAARRSEGGLQLAHVERMTEQADVEPVPTRVVLLSDGENTAGRSPDAAAAGAAEAALPVSTIAYGTPNGTIEGPQGSSRCPSTRPPWANSPRPPAGPRIPRRAARSSNVYDDIGSSIGWRTQQQEVTPYLAALGLLVAVGAGALSLRWFSRLI